MSTRRGEGNRNRPQKHQNNFAWKFDKFKTDPKTKVVAEIVVQNCCAKCTGVIEWKIKYGKYKPLTQPAKCTNCHEKRVKSAYQVLCIPCVNLLEVCAKCRQKEDIVNTREHQLLLDTELFQSEIKKELSTLPERKRRSFLRMVERRENDLNKAIKERERAEREDLPGAEKELPTLIEIRRDIKEKAKEAKEKFGRTQGSDDFELDDLNLNDDEDLSDDEF